LANGRIADEDKTAAKGNSVDAVFSVAAGMISL